MTTQSLAEAAGRIERTATPVRGGGVVASPPETVYGLGASAFQARAVARGFELRDSQHSAGRIGLLSFRRPLNRHGLTAVESLSEDGDLREAAASRFAAIRRLDAQRLDLILAEPVPETGLGRAIMDRLRRVAAGATSHFDSRETT